MSDSIVSLAEDQARAVHDVAKLGGLSFDTTKDAMRAIARVLGTNPEDFAGLAGGDWLRLKRARNFMNIERRARARLDARGVGKPSEIPLNVAVPLIEALSEENREELVGLWAKLLAAAMDPARSRLVRSQFVPILRSLEPVDAVVFEATRICFDPEYNERREFTRLLSPAAIGRLENGLITTSDLSRLCGIEQDLIEISTAVLSEQKLLATKEIGSNTDGQYTMISPTPMGRSLLNILGR